MRVAALECIVYGLVPEASGRALHLRTLSITLCTAFPSVLLQQAHKLAIEVKIRNKPERRCSPRARYPPRGSLVEPVVLQVLFGVETRM